MLTTAEELTLDKLVEEIKKTTGSKFKEVKNIHQDTWSIEESEASQDSYRNQLTGSIYRFGRKTAGELSLKWTIGQYSYAEKAEFLGGTVIGDNEGWSRKKVEDIQKTLVALTWDDQLCVIPKANIKSNEANTDKAIGIAITGTALEPEIDEIDTEYWYDATGKF